MNLLSLKKNNFKLLGKKDLIQIKGGKGECHFSWEHDCGESSGDEYCEANPSAPGCPCAVNPWLPHCYN